MRERVLARARRLTALPLLLRLDSGNDALGSIATVITHHETHSEAAPAHYLIKWNQRQENQTQWMIYAEECGDWSTPRPGKRVALFEVRDTRFLDGYKYPLRRVIRVIERIIDKHGQHLLISNIEIEGWWSSLEFDDEAIIALYADHATSEQFHSAFKTDLDIEPRLWPFLQSGDGPARDATAVPTRPLSRGVTAAARRGQAAPVSGRGTRGHAGEGRLGINSVCSEVDQDTGRT